MGKKLLILIFLCVSIIFGQEWVRRYNGVNGGMDEATAIAVDDNGNVYVTGWSYGEGTDYDYPTIKYNSSGEEVWGEDIMDRVIIGMKLTE